MARREPDNFHEICCPSCFQVFRIAGPAPRECPTEWDYDCEVCCRPMIIAFTCDEDSEVRADARGINE
jgi:hypothetical protein